MREKYLTRISNVRKNTKFKRSTKAISPVIATLLMIAIAVVASLVVYAWVTGYIGTQTGNVGKAIALPSFAIDENDNNALHVYVQNVGQGTVKLSDVYINDVQKTFENLNYPDNQLPEGRTSDLKITGPFDPNVKLTIKATTTDGTFMTTIGTPKSGSGGGSGNPAVQYTVTMVLGANGGTITPTAGDHVYNEGQGVAISASADSGYHFSSWSSSSGSITFGDANSASTTATISADGTITANFAADTVQYSVTFVLGTNGATITPTAGAYTYDEGSVLNIDTTASSGYHFSSWSSSSGSITFGDANSASTTATISADGTITANFAANTQQGTIYPEADATYTSGSHTGGARADMQSSNNVYYISRCGNHWSWFTTYYDNLEYYCQFDIDDISVARNTVTKLEITLEGHYQTDSGTSTTATQTMYIYNFNSHQWEQKDSASITGSTDSTRSFSITGSFTDYIDSGGNIRIRVNAPDLNTDYYHFNDYFAIVVTHS